MSKSPNPNPTAAASTEDLEVKDAQLIFNSVWKDLEKEYGKRNLRFPKELILLGGAPGAGKGTNTDFICEVRDITVPPIVVSDLLKSPEAEAIKAQGGMVGDREVLGIVLRKLLDPDYSGGHGSGRIPANESSSGVPQDAV